MSSTTMIDERRPCSYIENVEVHDLRSSSSSQVSMNILIDGNDVHESPIIKVQSESIPILPIGLSVGDFDTLSIIEFKLFSHRENFPFRKLLGHAMNVISDISGSTCDTVSLSSNSSPPSVICTLKVFWSNDLRQAAEDCVNEPAKPETPLARVERLLDNLEPIKRMNDLLSETHPVAKTILKKQAKTDNLVMELYEDMLSVYDQASREEILQQKDELQPVYESLFKQTIECSHFIKMYEKKSVTDRLLDRKLLDKAKEISAGFKKLHHQLHHRIAENLIVTLGIQQDIANLTIQNTLRDLHPPKMLEVKLKCMPGTRAETINYLMGWITECSGGVLWCSGLAGTGKSSLAGTLHEHLTVSGGRNCLGAFIRYDRTEYNQASYLIKSIAYSLGMFDPRIGNTVALAMQRNRSVTGLSVSSALQQFDLLLRHPLEAVSDLATEGPIVVTIDGEVLALLFLGFGPRLPFMRLLIFSRPVKNILQSFRLADQTTVTEQSEYVRRDIKYFIGAKFDEIYEVQLPDTTFKNICEEHHVVEELASRASGLFIWAATRLDMLLDISIPKDAIQSLTDLYRTALETIVSELESDDVKECILHVLGLTADLLDALILTPDHDLSAQCVLEKLGKSGGFNRLIHKSFDNFLTDPSHCGERWFINIEDHKNKFARQYWVPPKSAKTLKQYHDNIPYHIRDYALLAPLDSNDLRILFEDQLSLWLQLASTVGKRHALLNEMAEVRLWADRLKDRAQNCSFLPLVYHACQHAELESL
ncbi:hypothetical protein ARMGADRAFT_1019906 [Armillaria gallica]|uniref:Nephrocystin 3-like N-terminal domain-containing protein n=1 Tax=Armillaria gallica TaxID=47427 RepID=A0A2H3CG25_ARMGA|nr:hypothetical protein ARMGADRAFT_1019906 [Armillaria gallica]